MSGVKIERVRSLPGGIGLDHVGFVHVRTPYSISPRPQDVELSSDCYIEAL
jgi:hypothetical protein